MGRGGHAMGLRMGVKLGQDCLNLEWGSGLLVPRAGACSLALALARGPLVLLVDATNHIPEHL